MRRNPDSRFAAKADILRKELQQLLDENHMVIYPVPGLTTPSGSWYRIARSDDYNWHYAFALNMQLLHTEERRLEWVIYAVKLAIKSFKETYGEH